MSGLKKKIKKGILYSLVSLVLLLIISVIYIYKNIDEIADSRLKKVLNENFGEFYSLKFETIEKDFSMSTLTFTVNKAEFYSDTTDLEGIKKFPIIFFKTDKLKIEKIDTWDILWGNHVDLKKILLDNSNFKMYLRNNESKTHSTSKKKNTESFLNDIDLDLLELNKGKIEIYDFTTSQKIFYGDSMLLKLSDIYIDLTKLDDYKTSFKYTGIEAESKNAALTPVNGIYNYSMELINISEKNRELNLEGIHINTKKSLSETSKLMINHQEIINLTLRKLQINELNFHELVYGDQLLINKISVSDAYIDVYKNKLKTLESDFEKKVFNEIIRSINYPLQIDTIDLNGVDVNFELISNYNLPSSKIQININTGQITNFTTIPTQNDELKIQLNGELMNKGVVDFKASISIFDSINNSQSFEGSLTGLPVNVFNPLIKTFSNVQIKSGIIERVDFKGTTDRMNSKGFVTFLYSDLKLSLYDVMSENKGIKGFILTGVGNLAVHESNPSPKETIRTSPFLFKREKWQGNVALWLGGILDGMLKTTMKDFTEKIVEKRK